MRITPLAIWTHKLSVNDVDTAVRAEVTLTHPSEVSQRVCVCYCLCIKYLIQEDGDGLKAIKMVRYFLNYKVLGVTQNPRVIMRY